MRGVRKLTRARKADAERVVAATAAGVPRGAGGRWERAGSPVLRDVDRELLALALNVQQCAESAFNLVLRADTQAHVARFGSVEAAKLRERQRMQRMLLAWRDLRAEDGAPYPDARMFLTEGLLFYAGIRRVPLPGATLEQEQHELHANAERLSNLVASHYQALAEKMREPARVDRIRMAIESAAASPKKIPWKVIARMWDGIEKQDQDSEAWRVAWDKHKRRMTARHRAAGKRT